MKKDPGLLFVSIMSAALIAAVIFAATIQDHRHKVRIGEAKAEISRLEKEISRLAERNSASVKENISLKAELDSSKAEIQKKSSEISSLEESWNSMFSTWKKFADGQAETIKVKSDEITSLQERWASTFSTWRKLADGQAETIKVKSAEIASLRESWDAMFSEWRKFSDGQSEIIVAKAWENAALAREVEDKGVKLREQARMISLGSSSDASYGALADLLPDLGRISVSEKIIVKPVLFIPKGYDFNLQDVSTQDKQNVDIAAKVVQYWFAKRTGATFSLREPVILVGEKTIKEYESFSSRDQATSVLLEVEARRLQGEEGKYHYMIFMYGKTDTNWGFYYRGAVLGAWMIKSGYYSILPYTTHELGHAFGLPHPPPSDLKTIMKISDDGKLYYGASFFDRETGLTSEEAEAVKNYFLK